MRKIIVLLVISLFFSVPLSTTAESAANQRIVFLVYDDSGSMKQITRDGERTSLDNWKYANYALQSLVALLDSQDELHITKMSDPEKTDSVQLEHATSEIERIRLWSAAGSTPFQAVTTAFDNLLAGLAENPQAEYWLVVITDGVVDRMSRSAYDSDEAHVAGKQEVRNILKNYRKTINEYADTTVKTTLITIESDLDTDEQRGLNEFKGVWDETVGGMILTADSRTAIVERVNEVAALISNRDPRGENAMLLEPRFQDDEITLQIPLPLRKLTVLEHVTESTEPLRMEKAEGAGTALRIAQPIRLETPKDTEKNPIIQGYVTQIQPMDGTMMPAGEYTIAYDGTITQERMENFQFLVEPAIDFAPQIFRLIEDGSLTDDETTFFIGSDMVLDVELLTGDGSDTSLDVTGVDLGLFEITAEIGEETYQLQWNEERQRFTTKFKMTTTEELPLSVTTRVKGYYQNEKNFTIQGYEERTLALQLLNGDWKSTIDVLEEADPIQVLPLIDGAEISEAELAEIIAGFQVSTDKKIEFRVEQAGNVIEIHPQYYKHMLLTSTGEIDLTFELQGKYPSEFASLEATVNIHDIGFVEKWGLPILIFLVIIALLILIYMIWKNPRFKRGSFQTENRGKARCIFPPSVPTNR